MSIKNIQKQYAASMKNAEIQVKKYDDEISTVYVNHVRKQAQKIGNFVGVENGKAYIVEALANYPNLIEMELQAYLSSHSISDSF